MMKPTIKPTLETYTQRGWARLAFQFDHIALATLSSFDPHVGNGQRLSELDAIHDVLPSAFKTELEAFGYNARPKRAVGFTKTREQNWSLPWHQDRVIVMTERSDDPAFTHWTRKSGLWHCEPPASVLKNMGFPYIAFDSVEAGEGGI